MRLNQRLGRVEERMGVDEEPTITFFRTIYEQKDGPDVEGNCRAHVCFGPGDIELVKSEPGEDHDSFKERVHQLARQPRQRRAAQ